VTSSAPCSRWLINIIIIRHIIIIICDERPPLSRIDGFAACGVSGVSTKRQPYHTRDDYAMIRCDNSGEYCCTMPVKNKVKTRQHDFCRNMYTHPEKRCCYLFDYRNQSIFFMYFITIRRTLNTILCVIVYQIQYWILLLQH